ACAPPLLWRALRPPRMFMKPLAAVVQQAIQHRRGGRRAEAAALYREMLALDPDCADALHLLGVIEHQRGQHAKAVDLIRRAAALTPDNPAIQSNLGEAYRHLRR